MGDNNSFEGWREVPVAIVWLIMEKLHLIDNIRLAAVCKDFKLAFTSLPTKLNHCKDVVPWVLMMNGSGDDHLHFLRVSTQTTIKMRIGRNLFDYQSHAPLCSRNGWLLAATDSNFDEKTRMFLLNPITREKIWMPKTDTYIVKYAISDSVVDGKPEYVVLANMFILDEIKTVVLRICRPGDSTWTNVAEFETSLLFRECISCLCIAGEKIYCVDERNWVKIYDLKIREWKKRDMEIPSYSYDESIETQIAEKNDEIRRVDIGYKSMRKNKNKQKCKFDLTSYRLNEEKMEWEILSERDIKDTSWFVGNETSYLAKGKPRIYLISGEGYLILSDINKPVQKGTDYRHLFTRRNNPIPNYPDRNKLFWFDMN